MKIILSCSLSTLLDKTYHKVHLAATLQLSIILCDLHQLVHGVENVQIHILSEHFHKNKQLLKGPYGKIIFLTTVQIMNEL